MLTLVTTAGANLAMVHLEARRCVRRIVSILTGEVTTAAPPEIPAQAGPATPPTGRTRTATLPSSIRHRQAG